MKKADIEKMLKDAANKQEISDLQKSILNRVDTSKVLEPEIIVAPKKKYRLFPLLFSGLATAALLITLGISIGFNTGKTTNNPVNDDKDPINNVIPDDDSNPTKPEPSNPIGPVNPTTTPTTNSTTIPSITTEPEKVVIEDENIIINDLNVELRGQYAAIQKMEAYNIINVANTFNDVSFKEYEASADKFLTAELEESIVDDFNLYIYNIEDMLGHGTVTAYGSETSSLIYRYENLINIVSSHFSYNIYYDEEIIEEKNINQDNYKYKGSLVGVIVCGTNEYEFTGIKRIKNDKLYYETTIKISDTKSVKVTETFGGTENEFIYDYSYDNKTKKVLINQKLNEDGSTKSIQFKANESQNNEVNMMIYPNDEKYIVGDMKSRENELLTVDKIGDTYTYTFKNSNRTYTK